MRNKINIHVGVFSGLLLYLLGYFCSEFPYFALSDEAFILLLTLSVSMGTGIVVVMVFRKPTSISDSLLRLLFASFTFFGLYVINGYIGTAQFVHRLLGIMSHSSEDNVSGMLILTFLAAVIVVSTFSVLILAISTAVRKNKG